MAAGIRGRIVNILEVIGKDKAREASLSGNLSSQSIAAANCRRKAFLSRMLGRESSFESDLDTMRARSIEHIICLAEMEDVPEDYRQALEKGRLATFARWLHFPIRDYGVPENREDLLLLARSTAELLQKGKTVLIRCGYGRGRTGMVAIMVLVALGLELPDAQERVREAGSFPEVSEQHQLVRWAAGLAPDAAKEPTGD